MRTVLIVLFIAVLMTSCTNNATLSGANNNDTVELKDEWGREAAPSIRIDSATNDSTRR